MFISGAFSPKLPSLPGCYINTWFIFLVYPFNFHVLPVVKNATVNTGVGIKTGLNC